MGIETIGANAAVYVRACECCDDVVRLVFVKVVVCGGGSSFVFLLIYRRWHVIMLDACAA